MSETLRDLVVSLSLNSDNFTRNIKSIQKQIQEAESAFRLAGAGVEKFEGTTAGLSAKVQTLSRTLSLQKDAVQQYERALAQASTKLQECASRQNDYAQRLDVARTRQLQLKQEVANAANAYLRYKQTLGESNSATIAAKANLDALGTEYRTQCADVRLLEGQVVSLKKSAQNAADAFSTAKTKLNGAKAAVKETEAELEKCNKELKTAKSAWTEAGKAMEEYGKRLQKSGQNMINAGRTLTQYVSAPIAALAAASVKASISYESAFTSVRKTVNATESEFRALSAEIEQMSVVVATSADEIAEVVAVAGQLGIENAHLMEFARTMIDLGNSTDIVASEAASTLAKFANIMNMDQSLFQNLGSTLVDLGNNYATTESAIMEMSMRLAGAGHQVGLSEAQILGFATALSAVGIEAQMGGSAFSKALVKMEVASATGGQALEDFGMVAGMTASQFKSLWDRDPAAAFQAFIVGLSQMDDAGESAIAVLDEIGIKEVRLRDTLLRATNATDLFSRTQRTANAAWRENTALTTEAGKRYATTESKLTNLKNKAVLFARQLGNDLNPTIQNLIDGASDLIDRFMALDEGQRMQIIQWAAIVAAIGPAILLFGKISKGIGVLSTGLGKFALAVGKAGGGWKGFFSLIGKSPAVWMAVAAAAVTATIAIADYVSGAKAARDAMNGMNEAARALKNGDFKTIYETGSGDPLGRFGITFDSVEQAEQVTTDTKTWLNSLTAEWSDARVESSKTIQAYVDSFTAASDEVRAAIQKRRDTLGAMGTLSSTSDASMQKDMKRLAAWDAEIEQLLKSRRERFLSAADKARLNELITLRAQLKIEYATTDTDVYAQILSGIENEKARAAAVLETVGIDLYADALIAAANVQKNYLDTLNAEYDTRRNTLQLMADEGKRAQAQAELDAWYAANRQSQAIDYQKTLAQIGTQAYSNEGIQDSIASIGELYALLQGFDGSVASLEAVQAWMDSMDGGGLASVLTLMTQLADADLGEATLGFEPTALLAQWQAISNIASAYPKQLEGLNQVVNETVPEKANEVLVSLNLDTAAEQWKAFTDGTASFTATPTLTGVPESISISGTVNLNPLDQWRVTLWKSLNAPKLALKSTVTTTVGFTFGDDWQTTLNALWEEKKLVLYGANGLPIDVTPSVIAALTVDDIVVGLSEDGTYHVIVKPSWEGATAEDAREAVEDLTDAANSNNGFLGSGFLAMDAIASLEAAKSYYQQYAATSFHGLLPGLGIMTPQELQMANVIITPEMATQIADTIATIQGAVANGEPLETDVVDFIYLLADAVEYINQYGQNEDVVSGILKNLSALGVEMDADALSAYLRSLVDVTNQSLTLQESVSVACQRAGEFIDQAKQSTDEEIVYALTSLAKIQTAFAQAVLVGVPIETADEIVFSAESYADAINNLYAAIDSVQGGHVPAEDLNADIAWLDAYCDAYYTAVQRMQNGDAAVTQEMLTSLDTMFVNRDAAGIIETFSQLGITLGSDAGEGVGTGLSGYDFSGDAAASATALETALRNAYGSHSPATLTIPIGTDAGAGVGLGLAGYAFTSEADTSAGNLRTALTTALTSESMNAIGALAASGLAAGVAGYNAFSSGSAVGAVIKNGVQSALNVSALYSIGLYAMSGMAAGIRSGQAGVVVAMRAAARAAVLVAKMELQIRSPSRVFRDEVGVMTMKGFGEGVLAETKAQANAIRNATKYLTGEAKAGSITTTSNDNRKTYNQQSSISFAGSNFYVSDKQDAYALALEIASLTKRQQRGKGLRMA